MSGILILSEQDEHIYYIRFINVMNRKVIDLTEIFGIGAEPTAEKMDNQKKFLTDDEENLLISESLNNLRHKIQKATITDRIKSRFTPEEWEKERDRIFMENSIKREKNYKMGEVVVWIRSAEPKTKHVPRLWWRWAYNIYKYYKKEREDIGFIAGGILGLISFVIIIILANCL